MGMTLVNLERSEGVAKIRLCRGDQGNAMSPDLLSQFRAATDEIAADPGVRCVLISAEGWAFCVGGDLAAVNASDDPSTVVKAMAEDLHAGLESLRAINAPVVTAVQGPVAGGGLGLVSGADLVYAAESASFTLAYTAAGLCCDGGASWHLPRIVGHRRAAELLLTNRKLSADEAQKLSLVTEVTADDQLIEVAERQARTLAAGPTVAFGQVKRLLDVSMTNTYADQLAIETVGIASSVASVDAREGLDAFLNKRRPVFTGQAA